MSWLDRWFGRTKRADTEHQAAAEQRRLRDFADPDHHQASVVDGDRLMLDIGKVRARVSLAVERLDLDLDTAISFEDDVITFDELTAMTSMGLTPVLTTDVVNTATRVMLARYPEHLVRLPLPPDYDARRLYPLEFTDDVHERARTIVNLRSRSPRDLESGDLILTLSGLDAPDHIGVFMAVFAMCGSRLSALKSHTGTE